MLRGKNRIQSSDIQNQNCLSQPFALRLTTDSRKKSLNLEKTTSRLRCHSAQCYHDQEILSKHKARLLCCAMKNRLHQDFFFLSLKLNIKMFYLRHISTGHGDSSTQRQHGRAVVGAWEPRFYPTVIYSSPTYLAAWS